MKKILCMMLVLLTMSISGFAQTLADYTFTTGTDATKWIPLSTTTSLITPGAGDYGVSTVQDIGFAFTFGEQSYTQFSVNADGNLRFGSIVTGTSNYSSPFNSSNAGINSPKINMLGCDGFLSDSGHVYHEVVGDAPNRVCVIEIFTSTYNSTSRNSLLRWQVQLFEGSNDIQIVFASTAPPILPATTRQMGMSIDGSDLILLNASHQATHFTSGQTTTIASGTWPDVNRYYHFAAPVITCPIVSSITANNVTSSSFDLSWTPVGTETQWDLYITTNLSFIPDSNTTPTDFANGLPEYSFSSLNQNTTYRVFVRANCGSGDVSYWSPYTVTTPCTPIGTLPFTDNFDAYTGATTTTLTNSNLPYCWSHINNGTSTSYSGYPIIYSSTAYAASGSNALRFYSYTTSGTYDDQMVILPQIDPTLYPINSLQLSFDARCNSTYTFTFVVGIISNPSDKTTFVPTDTIVTTSSTYATYDFPFNQYTGPEGFIAIMAPLPTTSYNSGYIDNIVVDFIPTCPKPKNLTSSNPTLTSVDLSWTEMGYASAWEIEYGPTGFTPGTGTVESASTNPYTVSGLDNSTVYDFYVRANCGGGDTSGYSIVHTVGTACAPITTLPFSVDFDSFTGYTSTTGTTSNLPYCWSNINNGTSSSYAGYPIIYTSATYAASGSNSIRFYTYTTSGTYDDQMMILPEFDPTLYPVSNLQLSFDARNNGTYTLTLVVGAMTDPTDKTTFVPMDTIVTTSNTYLNYEVPFNQYTGTGSYIAIMATQPTSSYNSGFVDNIVVDVIPTCPRPKNVTTSNPTLTSIDLAWLEMGSATSWEIEYGPVGFTQGTGTVVNATTNPFTVSGLQHSTGYDFYVRATCGGGDNSHWTNKVTEGTSCSPISNLPFMENFDGYTGYTTTTAATNNLPYCWSNLNAGTSASYIGYPMIYTSATMAASGSNSVRFYTYSTSGTYDDQMAILPQMDVTAYPMNTLQVSFDARNNSTYTFTLVVGVISDPTDKTTFVPVDTIITTSNTYNNYVVPFNQYAGTGSYIALMAPKPTSSYNTGYVDNVLVEVIPTCPRPTYLTATSTLTDEVILSWTDNNASQWDILYGPTGFDPTDPSAGTIESGVTTNPYTLSGLTQGIYDFYVRANCGGGDLSNWTVSLVTASPYTYTMGVTGTDTVTGCDFFVVDDGGVNGTYSNNCQYTLVIFPGEVDSVVSVSGTFIGETSADYLSIYDGTAVDENNLLQKIVSGTSGNVITFGPLHSSNGPLTLLFHSDGSVVYPGFVANVSCVEAPACPKPIDVHSTVVTSADATLTWEDNSVGNFNVVYSIYPNFNPDTCTNVLTTNTNSILLDNLNPYTYYYVAVQSNCGGAVSEWSNVNHFRTSCEPSSTLPFMENFDNVAGSTSTSVSTTNLPYCWSNINNGTSTSYSGYPMVYASATYAASGSNSMRFYTYITSGTYDDQIAVLPPFDPDQYPVNTLQVNFDARANSTSYTFVLVVGVLTSPSDKTTFVPVDTFELTSTSYQSFELPLSIYQGTGNYIAFMAPQPTTGYNYGYVDNVVVDLIPSCPKPINLAAANVTDNSIELTWTEVGDATSWEVVYGPVGFTPGDTNGTEEVATSVPFTLANLTSATTYDIYVRSDCGSEYSQYGTKITVTTACVPVATLPYVEGFDTYGTGTTVYPTCWSKINTYTSDRPYVNSTHYAGVGSLYFYASSTTYNVAITPMFDAVILINTLQATFMYRATNSTDYMIVGVISNPADINTFVPVDTVYPSSPVSTWVEKEVNFSGYTGSGQYIAFYNGNPSAYSYAYIDNLNINLIPSCPKPQDLHIVDATISTVELGWTEVGSATSWEIAYGAPGFDPDGTAATVVVATTNPFTVSGLNNSTNYEFYVRSACSSTENSYWSNVLQGATTMVPVALPYTADFSDATDAWVLNNGSCTNYWARGTVNGTAALFVTDNGTTPNYTITSTSVVSAQKYFTVGTSDSITITFDVMVDGEGAYDYLKMFLAPASQQYPASTSAPSSTDYGYHDYSTYAYNFYANSYGTQSSHVYVLNKLTDTIHVVAKMPNPNANPTSSSTALLALAWKNDPSAGTQPPAIIMNLSVTASGGQVVVDPTVATTAATDITATTAKLNATVTNPDNVTITAKGFEWKTTTGGTYTQIAGTGTGNSFTADLANLTPATSYTCKAFITFNGTTVYGSEMTFTTLEQGPEPCDVPTGLTASDIQGDAFTITWDNNADVSSWNIQYRPTGGQLSTATATTNSYTLTGLTQNTTYQVQVQANCGDGNLSDWSSAINVTTTGIESWLSNSVSLYPNPAKEYVDIRVDGDLNVTMMEVYDVYGKLINTVNVVDNPTRINVSGLADGMYFVRVTTEKGAVTKTFVKK